MAGQQAKDTDTRSPWFNPPDDGESSRRALTRDRVVAEALAVISTDGAQALSMRALGPRLGDDPLAGERAAAGLPVVRRVEPERACVRVFGLLTCHACLRLSRADCERCSQ